MDINIKELIKLLPEGYQQACYETKAIERKRTVQTPEGLLVMCLYYIYGVSLMETSHLAKMNGTGKMSGVAFMKRFTKSSGWFQWITKNIKPGYMRHYQKPGIQCNCYRRFRCLYKRCCKTGMASPLCTGFVFIKLPAV